MYRIEQWYEFVRLLPSLLPPPGSCLNWKIGSTMAKEDRSESLRNEVQELKEEADALADRAKKTARHAEVLTERIKHLETQIAKRS